MKVIRYYGEAWQNKCDVIVLPSLKQSRPTHIDALDADYGTIITPDGVEIKISTVAPFRSNRIFCVENNRTKISAHPESVLMASMHTCPPRLINTRTMALVEFNNKNVIPPYAILSHRWGKLRHQEFIQPKDKTKLKPWYRKIQSACRQALQDQIHYIWVDICCIKQEDHADVSANIMSMYAYYQNAEICYAYIADAMTEFDMFYRRDIHGHLGSEWFRGGGSLQELLAPRTVIFFNKDWQQIGDKCELAGNIHIRTGIPSPILLGKMSILEFNLLTRMSWARGRRMIKHQDRIHCLQGLLDITFEPNYKESFHASLNRLSETLFDAQPKLRGRSNDLFCFLNSPSFCGLLTGTPRHRQYSSHRLIQKSGGKKISTINQESPVLMAAVDICPPRLIHTGSIEHSEFHKDVTIPPYAILSHRWIPEQEVLYKEFLEPQEETFAKSGYHKIQGACRQARADGIHYIWIDSCCIQQGNYADVSANITSMYGYYQNAEVCYAYLSDVPHPIKQFQDSEWFKRGWTLQELLAPKTVVFFNQHWQHIGSKHELRDIIHSATKIPKAVISGQESIQAVNILTRMSWAMQRRTTKRQDEAYCLQGLLGVSVKPNYHENFHKSFVRLGKAIFHIYPELREEMGIDDTLLQNHHCFYQMLRKSWEDATSNETHQQNPKNQAKHRLSGFDLNATLDALEDMYD